MSATCAIVLWRNVATDFPFENECLCTAGALPKILQRDSVLWGEYLSGALYWIDFANMAIKAGFTDPRLVEDAPIAIANKKLQAQVNQAGAAGLAFYSATCDLSTLENSSYQPSNRIVKIRDQGRAVVYRGSVPRHPTQFQLDKGHVFETNKVHPVCGNTWYIRGRLFEHFGIFEGCGSSLPFDIRQYQVARLLERE